MAGAKLTKRIVDAAKPEAKEQFIWDAGDGALKGFGLRVLPSGRKNFIAQFRIGGGRGAKSRRVTIGEYGSPWTVEMARAEAERLIREADRGVDLKGNEDAARAAEVAAVAADAERERLDRELRFSALAERFMNEHVKTKRKGTTQSFYRLLLDVHILPVLGERDARMISRQDVARLHGSLAEKAATANRCVAVIGAIFEWALRLEILPEETRNPTARLEKFKEHGRERYLSVEELGRLGAAIREAETVGVLWEPRPDGKVKHAPKEENRRVIIAPGAAAALRLLLFTGARLREILHLEWDAVDVERGLLRLRDSKTGPKVIVLNAPGRAVLAALPRAGKFVIPGEVATAEDGRRVERPRSDLKRPWALVTRAAGLSGLRIHDLRHSFASVGAGDGIGLAVVGKLLGHTQSKTTEKYAHLDADPLRKASDAIATRIAAAMGGGRRRAGGRGGRPRRAEGGEVTRARPARKRAQAADLPAWNEPSPEGRDGDGKRFALLANGAPPAFVSALAEIAPGSDPQALIRPVFDAWDAACRRWQVRIEQREPAMARIRAELEMLRRERDLITQRQALSEANGWTVARSLGIAVFREQDEPPADPGALGTAWGESDLRRLDHLADRIAYLTAQAKTLDGRGDSGSRLRDFAMGLVAVFDTATGKRPTARDFARFVTACVALIGADLRPAQVAAVCESVAKSNA